MEYEWKWCVIFIAWKIKISHKIGPCFISSLSLSLYLSISFSRNSLWGNDCLRWGLWNDLMERAMWWGKSMETTSLGNITLVLVKHWISGWYFEVFDLNFMKNHESGHLARSFLTQRSCWMINWGVSFKLLNVGVLCNTATDTLFLVFWYLALVTKPNKYFSSNL